RSVTTGVLSDTGSRSRYSSMIPRHWWVIAAYSPSTRMMLATPRTVSRLRSASTVPTRAASDARWVTTTRDASPSLPCWRTVSIETPCSANTVATWARTPGLSATSRLMWYRVTTSPIGETGSAAYADSPGPVAPLSRLRHTATRSPSTADAVGAPPAPGP